MRSFGVVEVSPLLDQHLGFPQSVEDFSVQALVPQLTVEALTVTVFPGATGFNEECLGADPSEPLPDGFGGELRPVVGSNMLGLAVADEQLSQNVEHILTVQFALHIDGQALTGVFIDDRQHPKGATVMCPIHDEVIGPDVVASHRPKPDARSVIQP